MNDPKAATADKLNFLRAQLPKMKKQADELERLINLAKAAPFAGANMDFLELQTNKLEVLKGENSLAETLISAIDDREGKDV